MSNVEGFGGVAWLVALRDQAWRRFGSGHWPTTNDEEWRRSDISSYHFDRYAFEGPAVDGWPPASEPSGRAAAHYSGQLHLQDGDCQRWTTAGTLLEQGVVLAPLQEIFYPPAGRPPIAAPIVERVRVAFEHDVSYGNNRFYDWHYSLLSNGALLYVPAGLQIEKPFQVVFRQTGNEIICAPHLVVIVEQGASASLIEWVSTSDEGEQLCLDGATIVVDDNAALQYTVVHNPNIDSSIFSTPIARVGRAGRLHHSLNMLGGMFAKSRLDLLLEGEGADALLDGLYFGHRDQHIDLRTVQIHNAPHTTSRTFYRGAARDEAHTIYQGMIRVAPEARGTDAYLTNNNLLLNDGARSDSIPSLNISTDEVRCSHGSTTGRLDPLQRFYLESRGYEPHEAAALLIEGFFEELISRQPTPLQTEIRSAIRERIVAEWDD